MGDRASGPMCGTTTFGFDSNASCGLSPRSLPLIQGQSMIVEWGHWARVETRRETSDGTRDLAVGVELHSWKRQSRS